MAPTVILLANGLGNGLSAAHFGSASVAFTRSFLHDMLAVVGSLRGVQISLRYGPALPPEALTGLPSAVAAAPIGGERGPDVAAALSTALASGDPAVLIGADMPHLPLWRLRDALTHLHHGADAVLGPTDQGGWYLLGLRAPVSDLLGVLPTCGEPATGLVRAARSAELRLATLPPWFGVRTLAELRALGELLRGMPAPVAPQTRVLLESGGGQARAVGG